MYKPANVTFDNCSTPLLKTLLSLAVKSGPNETSLPLHAADPAELQRLLTELCRAEMASGELLLNSVLEASTPLETLHGLKELAKTLLSRAANEAQGTATRFLYHAAIAASMAHHGKNISVRPIESRYSLYADLATVLAGHPLGGVFRQAVDRASATIGKTKARSMAAQEKAGAKAAKCNELKTGLASGNCANHPEWTATELCAQCGRTFCKSCVTAETNHKIVCKVCAGDAV